MPRVVLAWLLLPLLGLAVAAEKPVLFNRISGAPTDLDTLVHQYYGKVYTVVDVKDGERAFVYPTPERDFGPTPAAYVDGKCLSGRVMLFYVIASDGSVASPHAAGFTSPHLLRLSVERVGKWRFKPAKLDGKTVATVAASRFSYRCPATPAK